MPTLWTVAGWAYPALAAVIGVAAALWLRRRSYRRPDDTAGRRPIPWAVPVLAGFGTVLAVPFWSGQPAVLSATYVLALVWACALAVIDLEVSRLPDFLVLPAYPFVAVLLGVSAVVTGEGSALLRALACSGAAVLVFLAIAVVGAQTDGLGLGDVKLAGVLAALLGWYGWYPALLGLAVGFVVGGVVSLVLLLLRRVGRRSGVPFGPSMVLGAYLCAVVAPVF